MGVEDETPGMPSIGVQISVPFPHSRNLSATSNDFSSKRKNEKVMARPSKWSEGWTLERETRGRKMGMSVGGNCVCHSVAKDEPDTRHSP